MLLGWLKDNSTLDQLVKFAQAWGFPSAMLARWRADFLIADGVGLTLNSDASSIRLYTQHWDNPIDDVVYRGYKSLPDGTNRVDEYRFKGDLRQAENLAFAKRYTSRPEAIDRLIDVAGEAELVFSSITNSGRTSWLVTCRTAGVTERDVLGAGSDATLLHLAGGIDASKGTFDTIYIRSNNENAVDFCLGTLAE